MEEDFDFAEMMTKIVMDAERKKARRDAAQQSVERMVDLVGRFNGNEVPNFLRAYNAEMTEMGMDESTRLDFVCRVAAVIRYEEDKELREAHESWKSFEGALLEAYGYAEPEGRGRHEFDHGWRRRGAIGMRWRHSESSSVISLNSRSGNGDRWGRQSPPIFEDGPSRGKN